MDFQSDLAPKLSIWETSRLFDKESANPLSPSQPNQLTIEPSDLACSGIEIS